MEEEVANFNSNHFYNVITEFRLTKKIVLNAILSCFLVENKLCQTYHRKLTLKVRFLHFLTSRHYVSSQNKIISFWNIDF